MSYFKIKPTRLINLTNDCRYASFIAEVTPPSNLEQWDAHLFSTILSTIFSFSVLRPIRGMRDSIIRSKLTDDDYRSLGLQSPHLILGNGSVEYTLALKTLKKYKNSLVNTVRIVLKLSDKDYRNAVLAMHLVQLSLLNKRDDFGLAYYLLVSAIELVATKAISGKSYKKPHELEPCWVELSKKSQVVKELHMQYKSLRGNTKYLKQRFVDFILQYCPPEKWGGLGHPQDNEVALLNRFYNGRGTSGRKVNWNWIVNKKWHEIYPSDILQVGIRNIIVDMYDHRSSFTHEGIPPPHKKSESHNRYFDEVTIFNEQSDEPRILILPNFRLLAFIAKTSITNYLKELNNHKIT